MTMKAVQALTGICALACLLFAGAASAQPKAGPMEGAAQLTLFVGQIRTLPIAGVQRVAVGNGRVITTNVLEKEVLLLAEQPGETDLYIWLKGGGVHKYSVRVTQSDLTETQRQLTRVLSGMPGVKAERVGDYVVITGNTTKVNLQRIATVSSNFRQVINMVQEEPVTLKKMVYLKVQIVEFKRSALQNIGIRWASEISGPAGAFAWDLVTSGGFTARQPDPGIPANVFSTLPPRVSPPLGYLGIATSITSRINLAVNNGDAYILATPELSTRSGGEAKFLAGGQIPIVTPASGLSPPTVTYKDYGIKLSINPVADDQNNVMAVIKSELSSVDPATAVQGNPGFLTRSTDSEINVKDGQTIVLSGLVNAEMSNQVDKLPWLGDIPVLGQLFRSTDFRNNRTDLVIFVTPTLVDPNHTLTRERIEKAREIREKFEGFLDKKGIVD
jgi:pilus assembly protein CpaC